MGNPLSSAYKFVFGEGLDKGGCQRESDQAAVEESKKRRQGQEGDNSRSQGNKYDRWIKDYDDKRQRSYYYNPARQEIVWKPPPPPKSNNNGASTSRTSIGSSSKTQWLQQRLPSGSEWKVAYDRSQRKPYYYNPTTQESKWELSSTLSSSSSSSNTSVVVTIEYQGRRGLVVVATSPTESSSSLSFSTLRSTIEQKHSRSVFYPKNLEEDKEEWIFQLKHHGPSANIQIMPEQEDDVELFQNLTRQYQQSQSSGTSPIPIFELAVVEKKEKNVKVFETSNRGGHIKDHQENNNDETDVDAVLVEKPVAASTATSVGRQDHQSPSLSSTTVRQPPVHARMSTPQPTAQYQNQSQVNHPSPQAAAAVGTRSSRSAGTPNSGTTNRSGTRNSIANVPASTPPIPPLPKTTIAPPKSSTTRRSSGVAPPLPLPQPQQQQQRRSKPPTPTPAPPLVPPTQQQQNLMTTRRTRRSNSGSSASSFNQQHHHLGV